MQISTKVLQATTLAMVLGLAILLYTQLGWIERAKKMTRQNFQERVYAAMTDIANLQATNGLAHYQKKLSSSRLSVGDSLALARLMRELIHTSLRKDRLPSNFHFALVEDTEEGSVILGNIPPALGTVCQFKVRDLLCYNTHRFVALYFTDKELFFSEELQKTLLPGIGSMVLICSTFLLSGYIMVRQKKVSEMQKEFINNLTHDFKTPLFTISMAADVIKNTTDPIKNNTYIQVIKNESAHLARQADNVLQHAMIEAGYFQLEKKEVDLGKIIEKAVASFSLLVEKDGGSIGSEIHTSNPFLMADEFHLYNSLYNLLDNAVKFSSNTPSIGIIVTQMDSMLRIEIKDNGMGIHPCFHKRIFEKFYRPNGQTYKGFGLGLNYVKKVVEGHEGKIWLESEPAKGSRFFFTIPIGKVFSHG